MGDLFDLSLRGRRESDALEYDDADGRVRTLTFGELDARANRTAHALAARGLGRGDRLCVHLANRVEFIDLFLACVRMGVIVVPVNVLYREREITHIVTDAAPKFSITSAEHAALFAGAAVVDVEQVAAEARGQPVDRVRLTIDGDEPAAIVYTSGTTGRSKGAVLTHNNFAANAANLVTCWRITSDDRYLAVLPLFHVHGLGNGVCSWLVSGCRMRLVERFDVARAEALFDAFQPTLFFGVPTIYVRLLELSPDTARRIGERARLFVSGSAPLPPHVLDGFRDRFGHTILERYGMSETLMLISNPYEGERRAGTVGFPLPGVSVRLSTTDGSAPAEGEIGQVLVRGPNVFAEYWRNPEATAAAFDGGWFRTGDLADRSADGYYTLRGRASDLIISGGFNIYPREIEELLLEQPGVREAAVVGAPDDRRGEVPVAYVVTEGPVDADALRAACARGLASFKLPRGFVRVESLPRNALGKVQKHRLPPWTGP
ncbi:MAG TPA: AMP-binding protein [Gemmatimonadaceae bacterium]|nr:AMP-binding protein [Gemmatimonadaceae bacterium]